MKGLFTVLVALFLLALTRWLDDAATLPQEVAVPGGKKGCALLAWQWQNGQIGPERLYASEAECGHYREFAALLDAAPQPRLSQRN